MPDFHERINNGGEDDNAQHDGDDDENFCAGVFLFGEPGFFLVKGDDFGGRLLAQFDALGDDHGLIGEFLGGGGGSGFGPGILQAHFHLPQTHNLAWLDGRLAGDLQPIDKSAVGGVEVVQDDVRAAQQEFAVVAGDGSSGMGKVLSSTRPMVVFSTFSS